MVAPEGMVSAELLSARSKRMNINPKVIDLYCRRDGDSLSCACELGDRMIRYAGLFSTGPLGVAASLFALRRGTNGGEL